MITLSENFAAAFARNARSQSRDERSRQENKPDADRTPGQTGAQGSAGAATPPAGSKPIKH